MNGPQKRSGPKRSRIGWAANPARARQLPQRRQGAVLVGVLACLLVGVLLAGLTLQTALRGRREARLQRQLTQTEWLCEGGMIRAVAALRESPEYAGETWQPELNIEPFVHAEVNIQVERVLPAAADSTVDNQVQPPAGEVQWTIQVTARLDSTSDLDGPMQRTQTLTIHQPSDEEPKTENPE